MPRLRPRAVSTALGTIALAGLLGCSAATPKAIRPMDLFGPERAASSDSGRTELPASATTFALENPGEPSVAPEIEALVASLLERRGWSRALPGERADVRVTVLGQGAGTAIAKESISVQPRVPDAPRSSGGGSTVRPSFDGSSGGAGYIINRGGASVAPLSLSPPGWRPGESFLHSLEVELRPGGAEDAAWSARAWDYNDMAVDGATTKRLVTALAERIPAPAAPSPERRAADRLGLDFLTLDSSSVVLEVVAGTTAFRAGWQPGDRILEIEGVAVAGLGWSAVAKRLAAAEDEPIRVELLRHGERYLTFLVPPAPRRLA